ncbi:MAG: 16S rRNA (uracil(1498)-N(3))-methyltransferase [Microcystis viridis Mv_BB_P_19951000_S69]|uniref:Ribosomal RNA small subunit methyltransferase E n=1 Tax=Microcystis viridis Mv_BB_P_19951000_S68D TaxID=2486270 RepID=A0A552HEG5_MICVR|nr:16S rRNA (uracil(1498)-N(3))-methyltransferase [Microcystis aeruginosa]NCR07014.1 16S rRNA (uracil(1498)-N(3))-methyltransferase [Microcystis aeruginosa LG13-11]TRU68745.1 MAG: 16S rRNA (uracil(1498)-N(3))-methyltransferase [Microcystis viridis Mv_BB_P_19951000_S68]TRU69590.1 MAG: 16S rRNA (uracil(1498)-N(3))-methyltransferase [Microcystis viridis Mv_BB_P_19951000_S68D]TRU78686.1 MAG: 16S rRNA (uracil(1498)-N(3))-methyltransferase [Microcystis viridis Mv_BB_P_19951000_S69]TRU89823.1 MAG: 16
MYYRLLLDFNTLENGLIALTSEQSHYLKKVVRLKSHDRFIALNGQGQAWLAEIIDNSAHLLEAINETSELPVQVNLMVAIPKNGFDDIVRAATELGVYRIIPLLTERSLVNPSPQKIDRWRKIVREAVEQSERQIIPIIEEPQPFLAILNRGVSPGTTCYIGVTRRTVASLLSQLQTSTEITIAIGPEGGWTEAEIEQAIAADFLPVSLGKRILRTITAPLVALAIINAYLDS